MKEGIEAPVNVTADVPDAHCSEASEMWAGAPDPRDVGPILNAIPDDPCQLAWTVHFGRRVIEEIRLPTLNMVAETLALGELCGWYDQGYRITHEVDGVETIVVISFDWHTHPVLVTAFPDVIDLPQAHLSSRYTDPEITHSFAQKCFEESDPLDERFEQLGIDREYPFPISDHRLITEPGRQEAICVDCGAELIGKADSYNTDCTRGTDQ